MSRERYGGGDVWSPLFSITEEEKNNFLQNYKKWKTDKESLHGFVFDALYKHGYDYTDSDILSAIKISLLKILVLNSDFAFDILGKEFYEKARDDFEKCEYESDALKEVIKLFNCAWGNIKRPSGKPIFMDCSHIYLLLKDDISFYHSLIKSKQVENKYEPLKNEIEKIVQDIKYDCYLNAKEDSELNDKLNGYIVDKYGYDFNVNVKGTNYVYSENFGSSVNEILKNSLLNDKEFWKDKDFYVSSFINQVFKKSGENQAKKIIDYIFESFKENENIMKLIKNNLSIGFSNIEIFKKKFSDFALFKNINKELYYPLFEVENESEKISKGKEIFESFLYGYIYALDKEIIKEYLSKNEKKHTYPSVFDVFNFIVLEYNIRNDEEKALSLLVSDFFTAESTWKRVYLKAYYIDKETSKEDLNESLFNCFYNLFDFIYKEITVETVAQKDNGLREKRYQMLQEVLKENGVEISQRENYVVSLIDRKSATQKEKDVFCVLDLLGEGIYEFSVAEMIFYNPNYDDYGENAKSPQKRFEDYTNQLALIKVAKHLDVDKTYISFSKENSKYGYDNFSDKIDFKKFSNNDPKEKYLGDSLKMILGAVAIEKGYKESIKLAKKLITDTFLNEFKEEVRVLSDDKVEKQDKEFFFRIYPELNFKFEGAECRLSYEYNQVMHDAFLKLIGCLVLKTENKCTRELISSSLYKVAFMFGDRGYFCEVSEVYYCYLREGIDSVLEKYTDSALKKYNSIK